MISLGIDTSNYTTSVAVASDGKVLLDNRKLLNVKQGELGLRQSDALYQHWENLPVLLEEALKYKIDNIIVSTRPRPKEGSYMPVFNAGKNIANILGHALNIPVIYASHQEGHILSASFGKDVDFSKKTVYCHLSGGTLELIDNKFNILFATKDISYGQLIDRTGLILGMSFPSGKEIDELAIKDSNKSNPLSKIHINENSLNLSGLENQIKDLAERKVSKEEISYYLMQRISESLVNIIDSTNIDQVIVAGGVASSKFIRNYCKDKKYIFGDPKLCSDNAVGLALSGGNFPWQLNQ